MWQHQGHGKESGFLSGVDRKFRSSESTVKQITDPLNLFRKSE